MMKTIERETAEQATGCRQNPHGLGKLYAGAINRNGRVSQAGTELQNVAEIQDWLREGGEVAIPNAGAGSYREAFKAMGFQNCDVFETTSSAGDWSFAVFDGMYWLPAFQSNRYPRCGFCYNVDFTSFETKAACFDYMASGC